MHSGPPPIVFSVFGSATGVACGHHGNAFYGAFSSADEARAAIATQCRLLAQHGTSCYGFYVYRSEMDARADEDQDDVRALRAEGNYGDDDPEEMRAFFVEYRMEEWV